MVYKYVACCLIENTAIVTLILLFPTPRLAEFLSSIKDSWLQFINHGDESIYDLLNGVAIYKVPATAVPKTEMELLFEV